MPENTIAAPATLGTTCDRKLETLVTSPSTRWISSPGVCLRWNSWSRPEHVAGDVEAQPVGDPPGRHRRRAHDDDVEHLGDDGDDEEQDAEPDDLAGRRAVRRLVDDATDDQRSGEGAGRRRGDERAEDRPPAGIRPDQRRQGAPARRRCLRHAVSLAADAASRRGGFQARRGAAGRSTPPRRFRPRSPATRRRSRRRCRRSCSHLSALRLTPPPMINRSGENRNTTCSR